MSELSNCLKKQRKEKNLSLKKVYESTGITDSMLTRIENGTTKEPSAKVLKKLADLYGVSALTLFAYAGYIEKEDIRISEFRNSKYLDEDEFDFVQSTIDFLVKQKQDHQRSENNEI